MRRTEGDSGDDTTSAYRPLRWTDVEALSDSERVAVERPAPGQVVITLPWARPRQA